MKRVQILFLIDSLSPGGAQQQLLELIKGLNKDLFKIYVITWSPGNFYDELKVMEYVELVELHRRSKLDISPLFQAISLIKKNKINIIHTYLDAACFYGAICKIFYRNLIFVSTERSSFKKLTLLQRVYKPVVHAISDIVIANSNAGIKYLEKLGVNNKKTILIRNGINLSRFGENGNDSHGTDLPINFLPRARIILMVGRIATLKNQMGVLEAYNKSRIKDQFNLLFVGENNSNYAQSISNYIRRNKLSDRVLIINAKHNIVEYYKASDLIVMFSDYEGSPNVVMEAMASARTVVSSNVGDVSYYINNRFGWILDVGNVEQLKDTFNQIATYTSDDLLKLGEEARNFLISLDCGVDIMVELHKETYRRLLKTKI
ncbi:MAG: glycosyltransferase [Cyclobacteriaceae bacterium]